ncbi:MAG TPA: sugar ABC transporter permease [Chloroflexota bacterium]|nr:sugar ABC transporter permease [Chloroflexota bacterium]
MIGSLLRRLTRRLAGTDSSYRRGDGRVALLFLLPDLIPFLAFTVLGVFATFGLSFSRWDLVTTPSWVGLDNYSNLFSDDLFRKVVRNTFVYTLGVVPLSTALALLAALGLNLKLPGSLVLRTAYFAPYITTLAAAALVFQWVYDPRAGLIDSVLYAIGVPNPPEWLNSTFWALPALIIFGIWRQIGFNIVLFLAGLQGVDRNMLEAASVDGAGRWARFRYITLPLISPTTFFVVIISTIGSFQVFDQAYVMTNGRFYPDNATNTVVGYLFQKAFVSSTAELGLSSAVAWLLFLFVFAITMIQFAVQRRWVHYG